MRQKQKRLLPRVRPLPRMSSPRTLVQQDRVVHPGVVNIWAVGASGVRRKFLITTTVVKTKYGLGKKKPNQNTHSLVALPALQREGASTPWVVRHNSSPVCSLPTLLDTREANVLCVQVEGNLVPQQPCACSSIPPPAERRKTGRKEGGRRRERGGRREGEVCTVHCVPTGGTLLHLSALCSPLVVNDFTELQLDMKLECSFTHPVFRAHKTQK